MLRVCSITFLLMSGIGFAEQIIVPHQSYRITKQPIVINTTIDNIQQLDPKIKSIMLYAQEKSLPIQIDYYSEDTRRYAFQVLKILKSNQLNNVSMNFNGDGNKDLIKVYLMGPDNEQK